MLRDFFLGSLESRYFFRVVTGVEQIMNGTLKERRSHQPEDQSPENRRETSETQ